MAEIFLFLFKSNFCIAITTGVLPPPPIIGLPTHITGAFERYGFWSLYLCLEIKLYMSPIGVNICTRSDILFQNFGRLTEFLRVHYSRY